MLMLCSIKGTSTLLGEKAPALHPELIYLHYMREKYNKWMSAVHREIWISWRCKIHQSHIWSINVKKGHLTLFFICIISCRRHQAVCLTLLLILINYLINKLAVLLSCLWHSFIHLHNLFINISNMLVELKIPHSS